MAHHTRLPTLAGPVFEALAFVRFRQSTPVHSRSMDMVVVIYADGACRGNPSPMGIGASIQDDQGTEVSTVSVLMGHGTNNIAEYRAAIEGLKKARSLGATEIELRMDSEPGCQANQWGL